MLVMQTQQTLHRDRLFPPTRRCDGEVPSVREAEAAHGADGEHPDGPPPDEHRGAIVVGCVWLVLYLVAILDHLLSGWK